MTFDEVLKYFKEREDPASLISMIDDDDLRKAVVAWTSLRIGFKKGVKGQKCSETGDVEMWNWTWEQVDYEKDKLQILVGVKPQDLNQLIMRLTMLRLVYPDGTINSYAKKYLQGIILQKLPKKTPSKSK